MKRVMIIGQPGSGKSTLARQLGEITGLPVVHIDKIQHKPGWRERSQAEKTVLCREVHAREQWIFEGGHSTTWAERLMRADTLIWLDFPVGTRLWRVTKRTIKHFGRSRPDMPENCPERFSLEFYHWIWATRKTSREKAAKLFDHVPADKTRRVLRSNEEVAAYLSDLTASDAVLPS